MRLVVMFDLPTGSKAERKTYGAFRKFLLEDGFYAEEDRIYQKRGIYLQADGNTSPFLAEVYRHGKKLLLVLYTSFTGLVSLRHQLPYLRQLAQRHRLVVVFFEDESLTSEFRAAQTNEQYYQHVIAQKFAYEQRLIVQELRQ